MKAPSANAMMEALSISDEQAKLIRALAKNTDEAEKLSAIIEEHCPKTVKYVGRLHSSPWNSKIWRVTVALNAMDEVLGSYGVEALGPGRSGDYAPPYEYLNMGDTYAATLIYKRSSDALSIGSWGDIAEKHPEWE